MASLHEAQGLLTYAANMVKEADTLADEKGKSEKLKQAMRFVTRALGIINERIEEQD